MLATICVLACALAVSTPSVKAQAGVQFYADGVIADIEGSTAIVELPKWPMPVEPGTKVSFFDIVDVFTEPGKNAVIVAEIDVKAITRITDINPDMVRVPLIDYARRTKIETSPGKPVLFRNELRPGRQYISRGDARGVKLVFEEAFNNPSEIGSYWESLPGAVSVEKGRLVVDRYKKELQKVVSPHDAAMIIKLNVASYGSRYKFNQQEVTKAPVSIEFDTEISSGMKISLDKGGYGKDLIGVDFVIGRYEDEDPGIHIKGVALGKLPTGTGKKHVTLTLTSKYAELEVDGRKTRAPLVGIESTAFKNVVVFCKSRFTIDNFLILKLPNDTMEFKPQVAGFDTRKERVAVLKGSDAEWSANLLGREIIFSGKGDAKKGLIVADIGDYVVCEVAKPDIAEVTMTSQVLLGKFVKAIPAPAPVQEPIIAEGTDENKKVKPEDETGNEVKAELPSAAAAVSVLYEEITQSTNEFFQFRPMFQSGSKQWNLTMGKVVREGDGQIVLLPPGYDLNQIPSSGYLYPVTRALVQPVTGAILGAKTEGALKCEFKRDASTIVAKLAGNQTTLEVNAKHYLISSEQMRFPGTNGYFELNGLEYTSESSGKPFWRVVSGNWAKKGGRLQSGSPLDKEGVPVLMSSCEMEGNFRFDVDVVVEKPVKQIFCTYSKDISCMFYDVSKHKGITFGFGAEGYGGVSTDWGAPGAAGVDVRDDGGVDKPAKDRITMTRPKDNARERPRTEKPKTEEHRVRWQGHGTYLGTPVEAKLGRIYSMRYQRIGTDFTMYINGRRIHTEKCPDISGRIQTWFMSPESILSIDNALMMKLPKSLMGATRTYPLGEFGYVVAVEGNDVIIDSDIPGLSMGNVVTIARPDKETRSKTDSARMLSMELTAIASGTVTEEGSRLTRVSVASGADQVTPGMKVLQKKYSGTFTIGRTLLADIQQQL